MDKKRTRLIMKGHTSAPRGKRSRGCKLCRQRRIKCGMEKPNCGRCVKAGLRCPGCLDERDFFFHNENVTSVALWHNVGTGSSSSSSSEGTPDRSAPPFELARLIPPRVHAKPSQRVLEIFYAHGIDKFKIPFAEHSMLDSLIPMWLSATEDLSAGINALAYLCCAKEPGHRNLLQQSIVEYGKAMHLVSTAIQNPSVALEDGVILNVVTLCVYEILSDQEGSLDRYTQHLEGAFALLKLREAAREGQSEKSQVLSRAISRGLRPQLMTVSIQQAKPIDDELAFDPSYSMSGDGRIISSMNGMTVAASQIPLLRQKAEKLLCRPTGPADPARVVALRTEAEIVDEEFQVFSGRLPPGVPTTVLELERPQLKDVTKWKAWPGPINTYPSVQFAGIITKYDASRLIILSIIERCNTYLRDHGYEGMVHDSPGDIEDTMRLLASSICSAVPFMLGLEMSMENLLQERQEDKKEVFEGGGAIMLVWTLFVVANIECVPWRQRDWIRATMLSMEEDYGIGCAGVLAKRSVSFSGRGDPWL